MSGTVSITNGHAAESAAQNVGGACIESSVGSVGSRSSKSRKSLAKVAGQAPNDARFRAGSAGFQPPSVDAAD